MKRSEITNTLQNIYYTVIDSSYDYDYYMYKTSPEINMGKFETISESQVNAIASTLLGYEYEPQYNELAALSSRETGNEAAEELMEYMLTKQDKQ